jgi:hypothetical protein
MNRIHQICTLATVAAASTVCASAQSIPAGYVLAHLQNGQPILVSQSSFAPQENPAANAQPAGLTTAYAPMSPAPSPYPGPATYVGPGANVNGQQPIRRVVLQAGTPIFIRTSQALHSNILQPGQAFDCYLDAPLYQGDMMIADRGAAVSARVTESDLAGKVAGQSHLALQLFRLQTVDGKSLDIHTTTQSLSGGTSYGKDVARIAGGAAIGAVLGGLLGGGRGAAIGAGVGAGGGTVATLRTRGPQVVIPSETQFQFQLTTPVMFVTW